MRKRTSEIGSIYIWALFFRNIHVLTSRTIHLLKFRYNYLKYPLIKYKSQIFIYTLTLEVLRSSDIPMGNTVYLSHNTLGHTPNLASKYFSLIIANPKNIFITIKNNK